MVQFWITKQRSANDHTVLMTQASSSTAGSVATAVGDTWAHNSSGPPFFYFKNINIYVVFKPDQKHHLELTDTGEIDLQGIRLKMDI